MCCSDETPCQHYGHNYVHSPTPTRPNRWACTDCPEDYDNEE